MDLYARIKPCNPRQGYELRNLHFLDIKWEGGERPTWYKVGPELAARCRDELQSSGKPAFDVVTAEEREQIAKVEDDRRLIAMGIMAATSVAPSTAAAIDLTKPGQAREAAIPAATMASEDLRPPTPAPVWEPAGGDLTTKDLPKNRGRRG